MITLSNGHSFEFMVASGALAFDGRGWFWEFPCRWTGLLRPELFTIVTKTLTRHPRKGNLRWTHPWSVVKKIGFDGIANAIGLTNNGIEWWLKDVAKTIPASYKIIVSIEADDQEETVEMIQMLEGQKILGIELNLSCPNTRTRDSRATEKTLAVCEAAMKVSSYPLIAKLSYTHDYLGIVRKYREGGIEAISINSVPWRVVFPKKKSPLAKFGGGGVSGKIIQPFVWNMVEEIAQASDIPVIGPSVWEYQDIEEIFGLGAKAVSFGSIFISKPWSPTQFVKRWSRTRPPAS